MTAMCAKLYPPVQSHSDNSTTLSDTHMSSQNLRTAKARNIIATDVFQPILEAYAFELPAMAVFSRLSHDL